MIFNLAILDDIRNSFVHGHPITATIKKGNITQSVARGHLESESLDYVISIANQIVIAWNSILENLKDHEESHRGLLPSNAFLDDCFIELF